MLEFVCLDCKKSFVEEQFTIDKTNDTVELKRFCPHCGSDYWEQHERNHQ